MRVFSVAWAILFWVASLSWSIYRLSQLAIDSFQYELSFVNYAFMLFFLIFMIYSEGYRGFHLAFAPRLADNVSRLMHDNIPVHYRLLAPLFAAGYIGGTLRQRITGLIMLTVIISFIIIMHLLPQPWRGLIDVGVVAGLLVGLSSIAFHLFSILLSNTRSIKKAGN